MAETVVVPGGLFSISIPEGDRSTPDEEINFMNMALARGFLLTWDYGERIHRQTAVLEQDLAELTRMKAALDEAMDWQATDFTAGTPDENQQAKSDLLLILWQFGIGNNRTQAMLNDGTSVPNALIPGAPMTFYDWPPRTVSNTGAAIGTWDTVQAGPLTGYPMATNGWGNLYTTSDGVTFYLRTVAGGAQVAERLDPQDIARLYVDDGITFPNTELQELRRSLELAIESRTQIGQNKQAFLQDLVGNMQKWLTFTTSLLDRRKRDAEGIVANFR